MMHQASITGKYTIDLIFMPAFASGNSRIFAPDSGVASGGVGDNAKIQIVIIVHGNAYRPIAFPSI